MLRMHGVQLDVCEKNFSADSSFSDPYSCSCSSGFGAIKSGGDSVGSGISSSNSSSDLSSGGSSSRGKPGSDKRVGRRFAASKSIMGLLPSGLRTKSNLCSSSLDI
jgi:hypothetical protein